MTTFNKQDVLGSIAMHHDGVTLKFTNEGGVLDHTTMRTAQLFALTSVMTDSLGFSNFNADIRGNLLWLVESLADEVRQLVPLVSKESAHHTAAQLLGEKPE